jgi:hypothetical protein
MSFQGYIKNIMTITETTPEAIKNKAIKVGLLSPTLTASVFVGWLAKEYKLGRGHSMALWKLFIEKGWIVIPSSKIKANK